MDLTEKLYLEYQLSFTRLLEARENLKKLKKLSKKMTLQSSVEVDEIRKEIKRLTLETQSITRKILANL